MSEEVPFKSMKITLSEEALQKLCELRTGGAFRSDSATIEECIRTMYTIIEDLKLEIRRLPKDKDGKPEIMALDRQAEILRRIGFMVARFGDLVQK